MRTEPVIERLRSVAPGRADAGAAGEAALGELGAFVGRQVGCQRRRDRDPEPVRRQPRRGRPPRRPHGDRGGDRRRRAGVRGDAEAALLAARRDPRAHLGHARRAARRARAHDRARGGQADQDRPHRGRARRLHVQRRRRGDEADLRRDRAARLGARDRGAHGSRPPRPAGADRRHHALQLPAQPRRAQGRPGARRREPDHRAPRVADAGERAHGSARSCSRPAGPQDGIAVVPSSTDGRRAARRGRPDQAAHLHGQPGRRLGAEGPRRAASASRSSSAATPA